jgi:hypothetical protein
MKSSQDVITSEITIWYSALIVTTIWQPTELEGIRAENQLRQRHGWGQVNIYLRPGATNLVSTTDWSTVNSIRIGILARTVNTKDTDIDTTAYDVDGDGVTDFTAPGDRNKRRVFQAVILLRNL